MTTLVALRPGALVAQFLTNGVLTDVTDPIHITAVPVLGGPAVLDTSTGYTHPSTGVYVYVWTPGSVTESTDYTFTFDPAGTADVPATEVVTVLPAVSGTWASAAEVLAVTGKTADETQIAIASSMIETYTGAYVDMPELGISVLDRRKLMRATAWQAVWLTPTRIATLLEEREGARSVSADTVRVERNKDADIVLAPMAQRELKNLSWIGTRSIQAVPRTSRDLAWAQRNFLNERSDGLV